MAVKLVRELSGMGLKDSLDHVEASASFIVDRDEQRLTDLADEARRSGVELEFAPPLAGVTSTASEPQPLAAAGQSSIRYRSGPNKIEAIKLVRILSGLGLKEAKDVVEQQGVVVRGISRSEADSIVARFQTIGSSVDVDSEPNFPEPRLPSPKVYGRPADDDDF